MEHDFAPPTHLDPEYLFEKYTPLRRAIYKKHRDKMRNNADREDLESQITQLFIMLVVEYDPHMGVDFPYYINMMLNYRVMHYVDRYCKFRAKEHYSEDSREANQVEDINTTDLIQKIIDLNSIDPDINLGDKHRKLLIGIIIEGKTIKELADEEGVPAERLHARFYFLKKKLEKVHEEHTKAHGKNLY